jgi:uncharacterized protein YhaN
MRIINLDLERYGPFTGQKLTFQPGAKLHIVYGRNEAGKSCSLAAITDLFFGIDPRTRYDFLHEGKELRIGATIESHDGSRLAFQRRKGNKNTLLDTAGGPLNDDALLPFLGSLSRAVFCHAFGLNTEKLREGAEEMLKSEGEVGASLFAAASGLRGLTDLRQSLESEADRIFAPRAAKDRIFYQALDRFETARKAIRELELKAGDWKARNERIEELGAKLTQIKDERRQKAVEQARLSRLKRVAPLLRQIDGDIETLGTLGDLPEFPASFTERLRDSLGALAEATDESGRAKAEHDKAKQDLTEISVDEALLAKAGDVQQLFGETAAYANDRRDMPRIQAEADEYSALLGQLAVRLGLSEVAHVEEQQPSDAAQALTRSLISEGKTLKQALSTHRRTLLTETDALAVLEQQRAERGALIDPRPLHEKFVAFSPVLKQMEKRGETERILTAEVRSLSQAAARLDPPVSNLDVLAKASLPAPETIGRFRQQLDGVAEKVRRATEQVEIAADAIAAANTKLQELTSGHPVPSADAIAAERAARDQAWNRLRGSLMGEPEILGGASVEDTIPIFERHTAEADRLADAAATDAERVAAYAAENRRLKEEQRKEVDTKSRLETLEEERRQLLEGWHAAWVPAALTPLPPAEMAVWLTGVKALLERAEKRDALKDEIDRIDGALRAIAPALEALADEIGQPRAKGLDAGLLAQRIEVRLKEITASWDEARDSETSARDTQIRIDKLRKAELEATGKLEAWSVKWHAATTGLGLAATATVEEAEAALLAWKEVPGAIRERDNRARRVAGMKRNIEDFEAQAGLLAEALAPDLLSLPRDIVVKTLADHLTTARGADARKEQATKRLTEAIRIRDEAGTKLKEADATISKLSETLPQGLDLSDLLARLARRELLSGSLTERRGQLMAQGDGFSEEQLRADIATYNADGAEAALKELAADDDLLDGQAQEVFAERDRAMRDRATLEQGVGAEVALQQRRNAEAELVDAAHEWSVLKLGAMLIGQVIDRHRASQQDPLMARAGELFTTLTGGAFSGLGQDFNEDDTPRLVGRRASGKLVPVAGLSEGTRDQLYLALRLAYLEEYSARAEAAPFIGDDLFTSFDEDRTASGLAALAAVGNRVQTILFTHHRHVVDIARSTIGSELAIIELT